MKRLISCLLFVFFGTTVSGQQYKGVMSKPNKNGLALVKVSPEVLSASGGDLDHLRILDKMNTEVPYAVFLNNKEGFEVKPCTIISKNSSPGKNTSIIVEKYGKAEIDKLVLKIGNSSISKRYSISGSNDNKEWFGLVYDEEISDLNDENQTFVEREFSFPLNNYKYIRFDFSDKNSLPINVFSVSCLVPHLIESPLIELKGFSQKVMHDKKNKKTLLYINFKSPQIIDEIQFEITAPQMYLRDAKILANRTQTIKKRSENYLETLNQFSLNSKSQNHFRINPVFEKELIIEIENQDNPVLEIKKIKLLQKPIGIVADLEKNGVYTVVIDSNYVTPNYDIVNFNFNSENDLSQIVIEDLHHLTASESKESDMFWQKPWFLWVSIITGAVLIVYFALGLLKDLEKKD
ncbi:discoidin domain-containing protein [Flavobacterium sp. H122]|uniref:discoidin domain-containing protein n=1 Tax=Flavobacterium sp. H122 TaxID=2529860 RepID=UPI0010AACA2A|nr:discoidin domain-containing protein [Flavobacterium sp. H122]